MSASQLAGLLNQAMMSGDQETLSDSQLVKSFVSERDQHAFAILVRRHGPMILGVCQRLTGHAQDAEDAFQAVFLTLARRAGDLTNAEAVGNWLFGVAVRTARRTRANAERYRAREASTDPLPDSSRPDPDRLTTDARAVLYEELARLPDKYRTPVVLCDLGGEPQVALARRLGVPVGTVYSRLATARARLAKRLGKRGLGPLEITLLSVGVAAVSPRLVRAATALAISPSGPPTILALFHGVSRTMYNQILISGALVLAGGVVLGTLKGSPAQEPSKPLATAGALEQVFSIGAPVPAKPADPGTLILVKSGELVALTPEESAKSSIAGSGKIDLGGSAGTFADPIRLSPDGRRVAYVVRKQNVDPAILNDPPFWQVVTRELGTDKMQVVEMRFWQATLSWSPDSKRLAMTIVPPGENGPSVLINLESGKIEPLSLPARAALCDWCRDGKTFLVAYQGQDDKRFRLGLVERGEAAVRELTALGEANGAGIGSAGEIGARLSPDGKKLLFLDTDPTVPPGYRCFFGYRPYVLELATRKRVPLAGVKEGSHCLAAAWSPDGNRVAYTWLQLPAERLAMPGNLTAEETHAETNAFLTVADADGKNSAIVVKSKATQWRDRRTLGSVDWR